MKIFVNLCLAMALMVIAFPALAQSNDGLVRQYLEANRAKFNLAPEDVQYNVTDEYRTKASGITHMYLNQVYQGVPIFQAVSSLAIKDGQVVSYANRFLNKLSGRVNATAPMLTAEDAVLAAAAHLNLAPNGLARINELGNGENKVVFGPAGIAQQNITVELLYQQVANEGLRLAWNVNIYVLKADDWWNVRIDAVTGEYLDKNNWTITCNAGGVTHKHTADCVNHEVLKGNTPIFNRNNDSPDANMSGTYNILPIPLESPSHGSRALVSNPDDPASSPFGWHDTNGAAGAEFTDTRGNNVNAQEDGDANNAGGARPSGGVGLNFNFPANFGVDPPAAYQDAAITNLFYMNNIVHDVLYHYGFDEVGGNFQENNYGNGGLGSDPVEADAQDGSGTNNANFSTPPDGSNPRMQMYIWTAANPDRDSDFDNGVIAHEYGHGVSNRLTGGPANTSCLGNQEQMGEGWSDYMALMFSIEAGDAGTDIRGIGTYVQNQPVNGTGIRTYPYCTNFGVNPFTYDDIKTESVPHGVGSVWCTMLWDMTWDLIAVHGFSADYYNGTAGNNIAMNLVMEGMRLQPCNPGFVDGRNAILQADQLLYGGVHQCLIWQAFADRGLGFSAVQGSSGSRADGTEAFDLPPVCLNPTNPPVANFTFTPNPSCGAAITFTDISTDIPQTWAWDFGDGQTSNVQYPAPHLYAAPGVYTVTLTVTNNLGSDSHSAQVTVYPAVSAAVTNGPLFCGQAIITTATSGGTAPFIYNWSTGANTPDLTANANGTYTMTVTDANGCSGSLSATVNEGVTATVTADIPPPYCGGPLPVLTANGAGGQSFGGYDVTTIPNAFQTCGVGAGPVGDDATNGPHPIGFTFNYYGQPFTTFGLSSNANVQLGGAPYNNDYQNGNIPAGAFGPTIFVGWTDFVADAGDITYHTIGTSPNRICVICYNNLTHFGGSGGNITQGQVLLYETTDVFEIHLVSTPFTDANQGFQWDAATGTNIRGGAWTSTDARRVTPIPAYQYLWSDGSTTATITPGAAGTYTVTISDGIGCTATASYVIDGCCSASIAGGPNFCGPGELTASGTGVAPFVYAWSTGASTATITVNTSGVYDVTITDVAGCTSSAVTTVVVSGGALPVAITQNTPNPICNGIVNLMASVNGGNVSGNVAYLASQVEPQPWGLPSITNALDAVYGIGGWADLRFESVNPVSLFDVNNFGVIHMEGGNNGTDELLSFLAANQTLIENWVSAGGNLLLNFASNEVIATSNLGFGGVLSDRDPRSNGIVPNLGHPIYNTPYMPAGAASPFGSSLSHNYITNGGSALMTDDLGRATLTEMAWGSGRVVFGGLTLSWFEQVNWGPQPELFNAYKNLYVDLSGASLLYTYSWSNGATTQSIAVTQSGTYDVTVTDVSGCAGTASYSVVVGATPTVTINQVPNGPQCGGNATLAAISPDCGGGAAYYLYSNTYGEPWGMTGNQDAMNAVYGAGNWIQEYFETANIGTMFSPATGFVFLEGSDGNADELNAFFTANQAAIEAWVANGGQLFLNAAPNEGGNQNWGFGGTTLIYSPNFSSNAAAAMPGHAIFNGPFTPVVTAYTGSSFAHAILSGPGTTLMDGDGGGPVLTELAWGNGRVIFGGMTQTGWQAPFVEAQNLRNNIVDYLGGGGVCTYAWSTGETSQVINVSASGDYTVTLTNEAGCTATATQTVTIYAPPTVTIDQNPANPICGGMVDLSANSPNCGGGNGGTAAYYIVSNTYGEPWGMTGGVDAMNAVYGSGNWNQDYFETVNVGAMFSPSTAFVYLEGSDGNADELNAFFTANQPAIEAWVAGGGRLFLNAAPNEGGNQNWGFGGVTLNAIHFIDIASSPMPGHPIFNGPYVPVTTAYTGTSFAHAFLSGAYGDILLDGDGSGPVLTELAWGSGKVLFGGMTSTGWQSPFVEAQNLRNNIVYYLNAGGSPCTYAWSNGSTSQTINVNVSGTYDVTITDANGCTASASTTVEVSTPPTVTINQAPNGPVCSGSVVLNTSTTGCNGGNAYYVVSNTAGQPWGMNGNIDAMNAVYGVGNWTQEFYETANVGTMFSPATGFVFLEGSDASASELDAFFTANQAAIEAWVAGGGRLFLNAAVNEGGNQNWGFGGVSFNYNYPSTASNNVTMTPANHPIFFGPFTPVVSAYTGNNFAHALLTGPFGTDLLFGDAGGSVLSELPWGAGKVLFGTMTQTGWQGPFVEAQNLRTNIVSYLGGTCSCTYLWSTGETTASITINADGNYDVTVTNCAGCTATATISGSVHETPTVTISQDPPVSACGQPVTLAAISANCVGNAVYIRGSFNPWGTTSNQQAMDAALGTGNWTETDFATAAGMVGSIFSNVVGFVFIDGSDSGSDELNTFLSANLPAIETWVANGGRLFLNDAPNIGGDQNWGFGGVMLNYGGGFGSFSPNASTAVPGHPIFNGPFAPVSTAYSGGFFAHASIAGPAGTSLLDGDAPGIVLSELAWGNGKVMFGGMTSTVFHNPQPDAQNLRQNIISYLGGSACTYAWSTGETTQVISAATSGTYVVTLTDALGCTATASIEVSITQDVTPPTIVCPGPIAATSGIVNPLAFYPLQDGVSDALGFYGDMILSGDIAPPAAPAGGNPLCFNGHYLLSTNGQDGRTPNMDGLDPTNFEIQLDFSIAALGGIANTNIPIIMGGNDYRWIGIYVDVNGVVGIEYNNSNYLWSGTVLNPLQTYHARLAFINNNTVQLFIDGALVLMSNIGPLDHGNNFNFTNNNFSLGHSFYGCWQNLAIGNLSGCGALVTFADPVVSDDCGTVTFVQTSGLPSGLEFPLGTTVNTYLATDGAGNTATCNFSVVVTDNEAPMLTCPANITAAFAPGTCGVMVTYAPFALDLCDPNPTITTDIPSGTVFSVGIFPVTVTATDASGNVSTCTFTVSVMDTEAPTLTCPAPQTLSGQFSVTLPDYSNLASASDNCGTVTVAQTFPAPGTVYNASQTVTVTLTATDAYGNMTTCIFDVIVDITGCNFSTAIDPPNAVVCPGSTADLAATNGVSWSWSTGETTQGINAGAGTYTVVVTDASGCTASAIGVVSEYAATTLVFNATNTTCGQSNGALEVVATGAAPFTYTWDNGGNTPVITGLAAGPYSVTVMDANGCAVVGSGTVGADADVTAPSITCPTNQTLSDPNSVTLPDYSGMATASDDCGTVTVAQTFPAPGTVYNTSQTVTVTLMATDAAGNMSTCIFDVTVTIGGACNLTFNGIGDGTCAGFSDGVATIEIFGGTAPYSYDFGFGAQTSNSITGLAAGTYPCTVTDANGCIIVASATVPEFTPPTATATSTDATCVNATDGSVDLTVSGGAGNYSYSWSNGEVTEDLTAVSPGTYSVTITDGNGCTAFASATVGASDVTPPSIACPGTQTLNGQFSVVLPDFSGMATASDNCGTVTVAQVSPAVGTTYNTNQTVTVVLMATDGAGNTATCSFQVLTIIAVQGPCGPSNRIYVDDNPVGVGNDGTSWDNAFLRLESALAAATVGSEIWVKEGTYKPTPGTDRAATFNLKPGISLYGGFPQAADCGYTIFDRDPDLYLSICSGDIGVIGDNSDNSLRVMRAANVGANVLLDGFVIRDGNATTVGAGLAVTTSSGGVSSPTVVNCDFVSNNAVTRGAGVYMYANGNGTINVTFTDCNFNQNVANADGGGVSAMSAGNSTLTTSFVNCGFANNNGGLKGGGISSWANVGGNNTLSYLGCTFTGNVASTNGAAIWQYCRSGSPFVYTVDDCTFTGNSSENGAGMYNHTFTSNMTGTVRNSTFTNNTSGNYGTIVTYSEKTSTQNNIVIDECSFINNTALKGGGFAQVALTASASTSTVTQSEFRGNSASGAGSYHYASAVGTVSTATLENNVYYGNTSPGSGAAVAANVIGSSNSTVNISFCSFNSNVAATNGGAIQNFIGSLGNSTINASSSIFYGNTVTAVNGRTFGTTGATATTNITNSIVDNATCAANHFGTGVFNCSGTVASNPMFVGGGDLHLMAGSPAIDAANAGPAEDYEGDSRPAGAGWDWGAYEYGGIILPRENGVVTSDKLGMTLFPNPTTDAFTVQFSRTLSGTVEIMDLQGRVLSTQLVDNVNQIGLRLGDQAAGTYFVRVISASDILVRKVVLNQQ